MILLLSIEKQSLHNITKSTNFGICATEYSSENICFVVFIVPYFGRAQNNNKKKQKKQNSSKQLIPQCQIFFPPNMVAGKCNCERLNRPPTQTLKHEYSMPSKGSTHI